MSRTPHAIADARADRETMRLERDAALAHVAVLENAAAALVQKLDALDTQSFTQAFMGAIKYKTPAWQDELRTMKSVLETK